MKKITVLLVDDHALVRCGFRRIIEDEASLTVVGEAGDGALAIAMARKLAPRVVLMDYSLPGINGLLAAREIIQSCPETAVLMLSMHSGDAWVRQVKAAGVRGYLLKSAKDCGLASAIKRVAAGELVFEPDVPQESAAGGKQSNQLSSREREILQLIVNGKSNREIAAHFRLSANTVAAHRANIMKTLRIHKTAELVAYAIRNGLANVL